MCIWLNPVYSSIVTLQVSPLGEVINVRSDLAIMVTVKPNTWLSLEARRNNDVPRFVRISSCGDLFGVKEVLQLRGFHNHRNGMFNGKMVV